MQPRIKKFNPAHTFNTILKLVTIGLLSACQSTPVNQQISIVDHSPPTTQQTVSRPVSNIQHSLLAQAPDNVVCIGAITDSIKSDPAWSTDKTFQMSVKEAKARNLTPDECVVILSQVKSTEIAKSLTSREKIQLGDNSEDSIIDLIDQHNPNDSIWQGRPWGNGGLGRSKDLNRRIEKSSKASRKLLARRKSPIDIAVNFVNTANAGEKFEKAIFEVIYKSKFFKKLAHNNSEPEAKRLLAIESKAAREKFIGKLNLIFARVYLEHFSPEELISIQLDRSSSPYFEKFKQEKSIIARKAKTNVASLFLKAVYGVTFALHNYFSNQIPPIEKES